MIDLGDKGLSHDVISGTLSPKPYFVTEFKGPTVLVVKHLGDSLRYS
jgi:hypothetical protein